MKKGIYLVILTISVLLFSCGKKEITTQYSIGCLGFSTSYLSDSQWQQLEDYLTSVASYNKVINFESKTISENDKKAADFFATQMESIDAGKVCSYIEEPDYFIYGIRTLNSDGSYRIIKAVKFDSESHEDYKE